MRTHKLLVGFLAVVAVFFYADARACDSGTVRDAAFHGRRESFRLGVLYSEEGDHGAFKQLDAYFREQGLGLNVHVEHLNPEDVFKMRHDYGLESPPDTTPMTLLAGWHPLVRRPLLFHMWSQVPDVAEFEGLRTNPALNSIARDAPEYWACLLYAPGPDASGRAVVNAVAESWRREFAPGVSVIEVDRHAPENALLCALLGITPDSEDWVGVVFARGKLLFPALLGESIVAEELNRLLRGLTVPCTCLQQAAASGLDLLMFWESDVEPTFTPLQASAYYREMTLDDSMATLFQEIPDEPRSVRMVVAGVLGALLASVFVGILIFWRQLKAR